jgi:oxalate---CoA ligase
MTTGTLPPEGDIRRWLDDRARTDGARISHIFPDAAALTWGALRNEAAAIAGQIAGMGLAKGDSVAIMLPNSRQGVLCLFGALYGG